MHRPGHVLTHRLSAMLTLEIGKRKEGMPRLMPSPILWWVKIFIVADSHYNYQVHGVSRNAVGDLRCVSVSCVNHFWQDHNHEQNYLPYLFSVPSQASLYEQFSYKWTVNHLGSKSNECLSKLRFPDAHFKHKRQVTALRTKYSDLT